MQIRKLGKDIWIYEIPDEPAMSSRVVIRLQSGGLFLHSPTELTDELARDVTALGEIEALVATNTAHHQFVSE